MMILQKLKRELAIRLYEIGTIKFGDFTLKSGLKSPIYANLRLLISYPDVMIAVAQLMAQAAASADFTHICGVPIGAIPMASISAQNIKPLPLVRPEAKEHSTKNLRNKGYNLHSVFTMSEILETLENSGKLMRERRKI